MLDLSHTFVTSDHHFGSWQLPSAFRVFSQAQEKELIEKWNMTVGIDDIVYYNGDFSDCNVIDFCNYAKQLNGQIVLIKGNHDGLPIDVYKSIFKDVVDEVILEDLGLVLHHCPGQAKELYEVFGHMHRGEFKPTKLPGFCSCVQFNNGWPVSLEKVLMSIR